MHSRPEVNCEEDINRRLWLAAEAGNAELVQSCIKAGANLEFTLLNVGNTALHLAALRNDINTLNMLISAGANVNARNRGDVHTQVTPLHMAARCGHTEIVRLLLQAGARINAGKSEEPGFTPLLLALWENHPDTAELLITHGADIASGDYLSHYTPLYLAVQCGYFNIVKLLLEKGATNIDSADCEGDTALHIAARNNNASIFNLLVAHGANIHLKNKNGCSSLVLVKRHDDSEILEADHLALVKHYKRASGFFSKTPQEESAFYKRLVTTPRHHKQR